jgi:hypothetical protein
MANEITTTTTEMPVTLSTMGNGGRLVTSIDTSTREGSIKAFNASQDPERLDEHLNEEITIKDVIMQNVQVTDEQTGEVTPSVRTILITPEGNAYSATSVGIVNSLHQIFSLFGEPQTWSEPLVVKVLQKHSRTNSMYKFLTLAIVDKPAKK